MVILPTMLFIITAGCLIVYIEDRRLHRDMAALYREEAELKGEA